MLNKLKIKCNKCNKLKEKTEFYYRNKKKGILRKECKTCIKSSRKGYYIDNKESIKLKSKLRHKNNRDSNLSKMKKYYIDNKTSSLEYRKEYYIDNKEECKKRDKKYYIDNKEDILRKRREYYIDNKDSIIKRNNERHFNNMKNDSYAFKFWISSKVNKLFRGVDTSDSTKNEIEVILGCSIKYLVKYLKTLLVEGIDWESRSYHIDHIYPLRLYKLVSCPKKQRNIIKMLNHHTNLQLLSKSDNLSKSGSLDYKYDEKYLKRPLLPFKYEKVIKKLCNIK